MAHEIKEMGTPRPPQLTVEIADQRHRAALAVAGDVISATSAT
jgi:hypothetical protein